MPFFTAPVLVDGVPYLKATPPGETFDPNATTNATRGLIAASSIFLPLATFAIALRVYSRFGIERKFCLDDGFMLAAWIFDVLQVSFTLKMIPAGLSVHMWNVPYKSSITDFLLPDVLSLGFFWLSSGLAKCSILLFYLHLFPVRRLQIAVWLAFAFVMGYTVAGFLTNMFACQPIRAAWDVKPGEHASCINEDTFYLCQAALGIVADLITMAIPLPLLQTLRLPRRQKLGVAFMISIGALVCVISCYRIKPILDLNHSTDFTYDATQSIMLSIIETQLSIIGGCIPMIRPFLRRWFPKTIGSLRRSSIPGGSGSGSVYLGSRSVPRNPASHSERTPGTNSNFKSTVSSSLPWEHTGSKERIVTYDKERTKASEPHLAIIMKTVAFEYHSEGALTDDSEDEGNDESSIEGEPKN